MKDKKKFLIIVFVIIAITILITDLILFWTSMQETGIGSGFSRYWR